MTIELVGGPCCGETMEVTVNRAYLFFRETPTGTRHWYAYEPKQRVATYRGIGDTAPDA